MSRQARGFGGSAAAVGALMLANVRFWPTVLPEVRRELRRWDRRAQAIPDPALRAQALAKLQHERFNTEVAATLATLVPRARRRHAVEAIVALEVMYDYLDGVTEQPLPEPLADGRALYGAFADAFAPAGLLADHCRRHPWRDDGGYLAALAATCRRGLGALPGASVSAPVARAVAIRCGEAQTRTHAVASLGSGQLLAWASAQPEAQTLRWWEVASGAAASVLAAHALIALAGTPATTAADAERVADAYLATCALTTLLDSLIDSEADAATGGHRYLAYYRDDAEVAERLGLLAREAVAAVRGLPRAPHHLMTVAGAVAFYLSAPAAGSARARRLTAPMVDELRPLLSPALAIFSVWRRARRLWSAQTRGRMKWRIPGTLGAMESAFDSSSSSASPPSGRAAVATTRTAAGGSSRTLGRQLERDRLEQRAERVRQVIHALRERAAARDVAGGAPRPLRAAIDDFGRELADLERRLGQPAPARR